MGNDYTLPSFIIQFNYFNPRSLVGNDGKDSGQEKGGYISIHVPSWGTTMEKPLSYPNQQISIHVPSWGTTRSLFDLPFPLPISIHVPSWGTTSMLAGCGKAYPFQSTFPRGERLYSSRNLYHCWDFNPRSLVGNDDFYEEAAALYLISIHVPSWGTTAVKKNTSQDETDFNPRSLVGNDAVFS